MTFEEVARKMAELYVANKDIFPTELQLKLYGLYKQIREGDNKSTKPWAVQFEARAKWEAWQAEKGKSVEHCKEQYTYLAQKVLDAVNRQEEINALLPGFRKQGYL